MKDKNQSLYMESAYRSFCSLIQEYDMDESIRRGVLVGFSGGPDSMLLLHLLLRYRAHRDFSLLAVHVHHGIRGETANRDAAFSEMICKKLGVDYQLVQIDVPALAQDARLGIEEAARKARYSVFNDIICGRNDIATIALGHNATDNLETVIFHLFRGCGTGGLAGISPMRDNVIRPLLYLTKAEILSALEEEGISYTLDETNADTAYTRNYIRKEILPRLERLSSSPEVSVRRVCRNLIYDNDFLQKESNKSYSVICDGIAKRSMLAQLHPAVFARVLLRWASDMGITLAQEHIEAIRHLINGNVPFRYDLPRSMRFLADRDICYFEVGKKKRFEPI